MELLENEGRVTVVLDDRGKVILVSEGEMDGVVDALEKEGRMSLSRLRSVCDSIIELGATCGVCCECC